MRILPDTRDLIELFQHSNPASAAEFEQYLREGNHEIVLSFTNVWELAGPLGRGREFMELRPYFQSLDRMPHTCMRNVGIFGDEISAAVDAFDKGTAYQAPTPYVRRWDATLEPIRDHQFPSTADMLILGLDEIIFLINHSNPGVFSITPNHLALLQAQFQNDRALHMAGQAPARLHFSRALRSHADSRKICLPRGREEEFAEWVYADPSRCPGLRLNHEAYRALLENYTDIPERGDFADLAHIATIPYVEAATLDRRMRNYCRRAAGQMLAAGALIDYAGRVYENLADVMQRNS